MNKIKYDKRDKKIYFIIAVATTILLAVCIFMLQIEIAVDDFYAGIMVVSTLFLPVISLAMWIISQ